MKKILLFKLLLAAIIFLNILSCKKTGTGMAGPVVTSIAPDAAYGGDTVTVYGANLANIANLTINNKAAVIIAHNNSSAQVVVPAKAGSGKVMVSLNNHSYGGPDFTYLYKADVSTYAGNGREIYHDGASASASFACPWGVATDASGNVFVADCYNKAIRKISPDGMVSGYHIPYFDNSPEFFPYNLAIAPATHNIYVTDFNEHVLRMDSAGTMSIILVGKMPLAGIAVSPDGNNLFISNNTTGIILKTDTDGNNPSVFTTGLITPRNIIFNNKGEMFVAAYPASIYQVSTGSGIASPAATDKSFQGWEIAADTSGNFYLADHFSNQIKKIDKAGNTTVIAGNGDAADVDGIGLSASFNGPQGIAIDAEGNLYITTFNYNTYGGNKVRKITFE